MVMRRLIVGTKAGVGIIFAVLLGTGSLLAVLALGYDFGRVYLEQQSLRNAASASAQALATACAAGSPVCESQESAELFVQNFLDSNSADGQTALHELCGDAPLGSCKKLSSSLSDCVEYEGGESLIRVFAASREDQQDGFQLVFTDQEQVDLWQCAQAQWGSDVSESVTFNTLFDLGFPVCDYPGDQADVVWFQFQNSAKTPSISRETSCTLDIQGEPTDFINVANGAAGLDFPVGNCLNLVAVDSELAATLDKTNWRQLCSRDIGDFLDDAIASELPISVALIGTFTRYSGSNIDFNVLGTSSIVVKGYWITNTVNGGAAPPSGWTQYPVGAPADARCQSEIACIYGYHSSDLAIEIGGTEARLVQR